MGGGTIPVIFTMRTLLLGIAVVLVTFGCQKREAATSSEPATTVSTSPESSGDPVVASSLKDEITGLRSQIAAAEAESDRYSGGLVKALIESRIQTLKQTLAMLEQRDKAFAFGLRIRYTVEGKPFQLPPDIKQQLPEIEQEIRENDSKIRDQQQEVAKYSGGLVQALSLSTLATMQQTQAMLNQRRLAIKYELPQYLAFQAPHSDSPPSTQANAVPTTIPSVAPQASEPSEDWEIIEVASRPGEANSSWTRFSWKLTLRNKSSFAQRFDATIEFRDGDGFPVDHDDEYNLSLPGFSQETFTGEKLIAADQVSRISTTAAKVKKRT